MLGLTLWLLGPAASSLVHASGMSADLAVAERFVDRFYAWDRAGLADLLNQADGDQANVMLYYQRWAEAGNYAIHSRYPCKRTPEHTACAITVTDDIGGALGYVATDTFQINVANGVILAITSTSDDPPILDEVFAWMASNRPDVMSGPCEKLFAGGTTPEACVREVVRAADDYVARTQ